MPSLELLDKDQYAKEFLPFAAPPPEHRGGNVGGLTHNGVPFKFDPDVPVDSNNDDGDTDGADKPLRGESVTEVCRISG